MITLAATNTISGFGSTANTYTIFGMELSAGVETYKVLAQGTLPSTTGVLYTVPASTITVVKTIMVSAVNAGAGAAITLTVNGTAASNTIINALTIPQNGLLLLSEHGLRVTVQSGLVQYLQYPTWVGAFTIQATTPAALGTPPTAGAAGQFARIDHTHQSPGGVASITSSSAGINSTETLVVSATPPTQVAGTTYRIIVAGTCTSSAANTCNFRLRYGPNGNSSDTQLVNLTTTSVNTGTNIPFKVEFLVTFQSTTVAEAAGFLNNNGSTSGIANAAVVVAAAVNTTSLTAGQILQLSYQTTTNATTTCTFTFATIEVVKM